MFLVFVPVLLPLLAVTGEWKQWKEKRKLPKEVDVLCKLWYRDDDDRIKGDDMILWDFKGRHAHAWTI